MMMLCWRRHAGGVIEATGVERKKRNRRTEKRKVEEQKKPRRGKKVIEGIIQRKPRFRRGATALIK